MFLFCLLSWFPPLYHSSCPNRTCAECDKFEENNLSHCKNISWFSMFLFHEFFMVLCWYWVKLLQITNKLDSYCGIKSISHVDLCDKWRSVWYGLLSHSADASCDKSPYHTLLHLSHSSIVRYTLLLINLIINYWFQATSTFWRESWAFSAWI